MNLNQFVPQPSINMYHQNIHLPDIARHGATVTSNAIAGKRSVLTGKLNSPTRRKTGTVIARSRKKVKRLVDQLIMITSII